MTPPTTALEGSAEALAAANTRRAPVYARVDGIVGNGRYLLMELELIEPYLFLPEVPNRHHPPSHRSSQPPELNRPGAGHPESAVSARAGQQGDGDLSLYGAWPSRARPTCLAKYERWSSGGSRLTGRAE